MDTRSTIRSTKNGNKQKGKAPVAKKVVRKREVEGKNELNKVSQKSKLIKKKINHIKKYIKSKYVFL